MQSAGIDKRELNRARSTWDAGETPERIEKSINVFLVVLSTTRTNKPRTYRPAGDGYAYRFVGRREKKKKSRSA